MSLSSVTIVGGSLAGLTAAQVLRDEGFDGQVTVVEPEGRLAYDRPPLSKQVLSGEWDAERATLPVAKVDLGLDWERGAHAVGLDPRDRSVLLGDGRQIPYEGLVVATGAAPRALPGTGELRGVHVLRTLDDCLELRSALDAQPTRVVVIGAGFIGAEVAATCRGRGLSVTMIESMEVPLARVLGPLVGGVVADLHRDHGVDLRVGVGVAALRADGDGRVQAVELDDGSEVAAEVVVVGIGVVPRTDWLGDSGLALDDGVLTDELLFAAPGVVAVGDLVRWPSRRFATSLRIEHWEHAIQSAEVAARNLLCDAGELTDPPHPYDPVPWFWSDQYDRKLQLAGVATGDDEVEVVHGSLEERRFVALYGRAGQVVGVLGMNRPRHVMALRGLVESASPWDDGLAAARDVDS